MDDVDMGDKKKKRGRGFNERLTASVEGLRGMLLSVCLWGRVTVHVHACVSTYSRTILVLFHYFPFFFLTPDETFSPSGN